MAEDDKIRTSDDIEKELTVGKFAGQQIKTIAFTFGGAAVGAGLGFLGSHYTGLSKKISEAKLFRKWLGVINEDGKLIDTVAKSEIIDPKKIAEVEKDLKNFATGAVTAITGFMGFTVGSIASAYEHWVKGRREQEGVKAVTQNLDLVMQSRIGFENTLNEQHKVITSMRERLEQQDRTLPQQKVLEGGGRKIDPATIKEEKNNPNKTEQVL